MSRHLGIVAGTLATTLSLAVFGSTPAHALSVADAKTALTKANYVALGDSFAAGTGDGSYGTSSTCYRSLYAYPVLDSTASGTSKIDATFVACSGATTLAILGQLTSAGSVTAKYVTLTVGGNDAGFADAMKTCLGSGDCSINTTFTQGVTTKTREVTAKITATIAAIRAKYSTAQIVVTGYPKLFQLPETKSSCSVGTFMTMTKNETAFLDQAATNLNTAIQAGLPSDVAWVDPVATFTGHGVCTSSSWINAVSLFNTTGAFHPNKTGQGAYAELVAAAMTRS